MQHSTGSRVGLKFSPLRPRCHQEHVADWWQRDAASVQLCSKLGKRTQVDSQHRQVSIRLIMLPTQGWLGGGGTQRFQKYN